MGRRGASDINDHHQKYVDNIVTSWRIKKWFSKVRLMLKYIISQNKSNIESIAIASLKLLVMIFKLLNLCMKAPISPNTNSVLILILAICTR